MVVKFLIVFIAVQIALSQGSPHGKIKISCDKCHTTESWKVDLNRIKFKHEETSFKLLGQHTNLECKACHKKLVFTGTSSLCSSCHTDFHKATLGQECQRCHNFNTWKISNFREKHNIMTRFVLDGAHKNIDCVNCHTSISEFTPLPLDCFGCHEKDYEIANSPNHKLAHFTTRCTDCHQSKALTWHETTFEHITFRLEGKHKVIECYECHKGIFAGTPRDCYPCHQNDYINTQNPNHKEANFVTLCQDCHTTNGWRPANFDHSLTGFSLTGRHLAIECSSCHRSGFAGVPRDCWGCHQGDYMSATSPVHTVGYPHECEKCHTTNGWRPANFNHDAQYFKIYSGKHNYAKGRWHYCSDCHQLAPTSFSEFTCISCHEHQKSKMDQEHRNVAGYVYESRRCYDCHRNN